LAAQSLYQVSNSSPIFGGWMPLPELPGPAQPISSPMSASPPTEVTALVAALMMPKTRPSATEAEFHCTVK
jgi:hypothetical protein